MKRWLASFLAMFLLVSTIGQVSMAARMPYSAGHASAAASADAMGGDLAQAAQHTDAAQSPCHDSGAQDCSDVCKRLCGNVAFVPQVAAEPAAPLLASRVYPQMSAAPATRTSPPDTPPPIA
ncbi:MAG: hypothetical protein K9J04_00245 [Burkholderiales bacterium]|nr:hypothetical protein [Burkholderiales bacterium]